MDESDEEEAIKTEAKEEQELGVICSWIEVRGFPALPEEEAWGLLYEVCSFLVSHFFFLPSFNRNISLVTVLTFLNLLLVINLLPSFQGLDLLWTVSAHREVAQWLEVEGLWKIESAVCGSEGDSFYRFLKRAVSHASGSPVQPPLKKHHPAPTVTVSHLPPQEPQRVVPKVSGFIAEKEKQALKVPSPASAETPEETIPAHMQPHHIQLWSIKRCIDARLKVIQRGHQPHMPLSVHRVHLGLGLVCPSCGKSFFNTETLRHHKKSHLNQ